MRLIILLILSIWISYADEASYNRGEMLYFEKGCSGCHGSSAEGMSSFPKLANKDKKYLIKRLNYFRAGKSSNQMQQMMIPFALKLSDEQIRDVALFLHLHKKVEIEDVSDDIMGGFGS